MPVPLVMAGCGYPTDSPGSNDEPRIGGTGNVSAATYLIDDESEIEEAWLAAVESVGVTAGASAPESLVTRVVAWFRERGVEEIRTQDADPENFSFRVPVELRSSNEVW